MTTMAVPSFAEMEAAKTLLLLRYGPDCEISSPAFGVENPRRVLVNLNVTRVTASASAQVLKKSTRPADVAGPSSAPEVVSLPDGGCIIRGGRSQRLSSETRHLKPPKKCLFRRYQEERRLWSEKPHNHATVEEDSVLAKLKAEIQELQNQLNEKSSSKGQNVPKEEPLPSEDDEEWSYEAGTDSSSDYEVSRKVKRVHSPEKDTSEMIPIGDGNTLVPQRLLAQIKGVHYSAATRKLLSAVFPRWVLATHSLTGKSSPAFPEKNPKDKLDAVKVNDIIQYVTENNDVKESHVRSSITSKLADEAKMFRNRKTDKKSSKALKKENMRPRAN